MMDDRAFVREGVHAFQKCESRFVPFAERGDYGIMRTGLAVGSGAGGEMRCTSRSSQAGRYSLALPLRPACSASSPGSSPGQPKEKSCKPGIPRLIAPQTVKLPFAGLTRTRLRGGGGNEDVDVDADVDADVDVDVETRTFVRPGARAGRPAASLCGAELATSPGKTRGKA